MITEILRKGEIPFLTAEEVKQQARAGKMLIIWDGLDEVMTHLQSSLHQNYLEEILSIHKFSKQEDQPRSIVACRTHFFRDNIAQNNFLTGVYRQGRANFFTGFELLPFTEEQILEFLQKHTGSNKQADKILQKIKLGQGIDDLATRPFTLKMLADYLPKYYQSLNSASLYQQSITAVLSRDDGKHQLLPRHKWQLLEDLAWQMHRQEKRSFKNDRLEQFLEDWLKSRRHAYPTKPQEILEGDLRNASLLVRVNDEFRFAHTSLQEFFIARKNLRLLEQNAVLVDDYYIFEESYNASKIEMFTSYCWQNKDYDFREKIWQRVIKLSSSWQAFLVRCQLLYGFIPATNSQQKYFKQFKKIDFDLYHMKDFRPLQYLTNLQVLNLRQKKITDLSPLQGLTNMQYLNLGYTQIADLSPLQGLTNLKELNLGYTQIADLSPLQGLTNLQKLDLDKTQIIDLSPLQGLTNLQVLDLTSTKITDLSSLQSLTKLQKLYLRYTKLTDLSLLQGLTNLQSLDLRNTQITDLSPLQGLTNLQSLYLPKDQIKDTSPLDGLVKNHGLKIIYH